MTAPGTNSPTQIPDNSTGAPGTSK
jgi:hypothetical protein